MTKAAPEADNIRVRCRFSLFLTVPLSFPDSFRDLVRPRKIVLIHESVLPPVGKLRDHPLHIGPDVESVVGGGLRKRIHRTAHVPALTRVGEEPFLPSDHERLHRLAFA